MSVRTLYKDRQTPGKCAQCGSTEPAGGFTTKRVIHQDRDDYTGKRCIAESTFTVCAGTKCGGHLQMSHEG